MKKLREIFGSPVFEPPSESHYLGRLVYGGIGTIDVTKDGRFSLTIYRDSYVSSSLNEMESILLRDFIMDEHADRALAALFTKRLRGELSAGSWISMVYKNITESDDNICHSHDFTDSNQCMIDAFNDLYGCLPDATNEAHADLCNRAWKIARESWIN